MKHLVIAAASALVLVSTYSAFADDNLQASCASDIQNFCSGTSSDEIEDCLQSHMNDLSPACAKAVRHE
jgi:Cysteine rich repeat